MKKIKSLIDKVLVVLLCVVLLSMVFVAIWGIFSRLILKNQPSFTTEYLRYSLLWTSLLSAAYCFGTREHIAIEFIKNKFKGKQLLAIDVFTEIVIILFAASVLVYGGVQGMSVGMNEMSPTLFIPVGYVYLVLPISGICTIIYSIINLVDRIKGEKDRLEVNNTTFS